MTRIRMRVEFDDASSPPRVYEKQVEMQDSGTPEGEKYVADCLGLELEKELRWEEFHSTLPQVEDIGKLSSRKFTAGDIFNGAYFNRVNSGWIWFEIGNTFLEIKTLLSHARTYKELEPPRRNDPAANNFLFNVHITKMEKFNLAMILLRKIEDLLLRLVFENLGPSLALDIDINAPGWEKKLTWKSVKAGIREGRKNPALSCLTDEELREITKVMNEFGSPQYAQDVAAYRNRLTHGLMPSVDYLEFSANVENRVGQPIVDAAGKHVGATWAIGGRPTQADYEFPGLYNDAVKTLEHYVMMLHRLRSLPSLTP